MFTPTPVSVIKPLTDVVEWPLSPCSFLVRALDTYHAETGALPLSGTIPDMTSTTDQYVLLQQVYQTKARADLDRFTAILREALKVCNVT